MTQFSLHKHHYHHHQPKCFCSVQLCAILSCLCCLCLSVCLSVCLPAWTEATREWWNVIIQVTQCKPLPSHIIPSYHPHNSSKTNQILDHPINIHTLTKRHSQNTYWANNSNHKWEEKQENQIRKKVVKLENCK